MNLVQAHVSRLRLELRTQNHDARAITSSGGGYWLRGGSDELDLAMFRDLVKRADAALADGHAETACALYEAAFELCHGDPCANVSLLRDHPCLFELRREIAAVLLRYADVACGIGRHDLVLRRLQALSVAEPMSERVHARLMVALAGSGEQAKALYVYDDVRSRLDRELGVYPGAELTEAHLRVLRGEFAVAGTGTRRTCDQPSGGVTQLVPRQLPAASQYFTGRTDELATLTALLDASGGAASSPAIPVVGLTGMAGIGKSALAVHWAYQVADRFPDGQMFVDLRGFSPAGIPVSPTDALRAFLVALGVGWRIPTDIEEQRTLYRSLLAERRMLIVLDNAQDAEQVRPLLPGAPGCFVLVTSRNQLIGLAASHGVPMLPLDCLTVDQSHSLLARGLGETKVSTEPRAVEELIELCAGLPLALCNTIARTSALPGLSLATLAAAMRQEQGRLDTLETGEKVTSVRGVFSWSHAKLSERAAYLFRLISVHPGPDITIPTAASLAGMTRREAYLAVTELCDGYLITEHKPGRFTCNDLLRAYAGEIARVRETSEDRRAAVRRVLHHYLHTTSMASRLLRPYHTLRTPPPSPRGVITEEFNSTTEAEEWLRAERHALLAVIGHAAAEELRPMHGNSRGPQVHSCAEPRAGKPQPALWSAPW